MIIKYSTQKVVRQWRLGRISFCLKDVLTGKGGLASRPCRGVGTFCLFETSSPQLSCLFINIIYLFKILMNIPEELLTQAQFSLQSHRQSLEHFRNSIRNNGFKGILESSQSCQTRQLQTLMQEEKKKQNTKFHGLLKDLVANLVVQFDSEQTDFSFILEKFQALGEVQTNDPLELDKLNDSLQKFKENLKTQIQNQIQSQEKIPEEIPEEQPEKTEEKQKEPQTQKENSSFFGRFFNKKDDATPMHLGGEAQFKYCPIQKRYIFEGEEDEPEEDLIPPPQMPTVNRKSEQPKAQITQKQKPRNTFFNPGHNPNPQQQQFQIQKDPAQEKIERILENTQILQEIENYQNNLQQNLPTLQEITFPDLQAFQVAKKDEVLLKIIDHYNQENSTVCTEFQDYLSQEFELSQKKNFELLQKVTSFEEQLCQSEQLSGMSQSEITANKLRLAQINFQEKENEFKLLKQRFESARELYQDQIGYLEQKIQMQGEENESFRDIIDKFRKTSLCVIEKIQLQSQDSLSDLSFQIQSISEELQVQQNQNQQLQHEIQDLEQEKCRNSNENQNLVQENQSLEQQVEKLQEYYSQLQQDYAQLDGDIERLQKDNQTLQQNMEMAVNSFNEQRTINCTLQNQNVIDQNVIEGLKSDLKASQQLGEVEKMKTENLENERITLETSINNLQSLILAKDQILVLETQNLKEKIINLESLNEELRNEQENFLSMKENFQNLQNELDNTKISANQVKTAYESARYNLQDLESRVHEEMHKNESLLIKEEKFTKDLAEKDSEIQILQQQMAQKNQMAKEFEHQITGLKEGVTKLLADYQVLGEQKDSLKAVLERNETQYQSTYQTLHEQIIQLQQKGQRQVDESVCIEKENEIQGLKDQCEKSRSDNETLVSQNQSFVEQNKLLNQIINEKFLELQKQQEDVQNSKEELIKNNEKKFESHQQNMENLETQIGQLQQKSQQDDQKIKQLELNTKDNSEMDQLKKETQKYKQLISELTQNLDKRQEQIDQNSEELKNSEKEKQELRKEIEELRQMRRTPRMSVDSTGDMLVQLKEQVGTQEETIQLLRIQLEEKNELLQQIQSQGGETQDDQNYEVLKSMYEKKQKQLEESRKQYSELKEKVVKNEDDEDQVNSLLREKRKLLEQNDSLQEQLSQNDFFKQNQALKQKIQNLEDEKNMIKQDYAKMVESQVKQQQIQEKKEEIIQEKQQPLEKQRHDEPQGKQQPARGLVGNLARFFLTEEQQQRS